MEVLLMIAEGEVDDDIRTRVGIGVMSLNQIVFDWKMKLYAKNRAQLIANAYHEGVLVARVHTTR